MNNQQIELIKEILDAELVKKTNTQYIFKMFSVDDTNIIFDTADELVLIEPLETLDEVIAFNTPELESLLKSCKCVLKW